jgi:hypothetical protein
LQSAFTDGYALGLPSVDPQLVGEGTEHEEKNHRKREGAIPYKLHAEAHAREEASRFKHRDIEIENPDIGVHIDEPVEFPSQCSDGILHNLRNLL